MFLIGGEKIKDFYEKNRIIIILSFIIIILIGLLVLSFTLNDYNNKEKIVYKNKYIEKERNYIKVDVKGEVNKPGVYQIYEDERVIDAINKAEGLTDKADTSLINLSKVLKNEMVIIVYSKNDIENMKEVKCPAVNNACTKEEDTNNSILKEFESENLETNNNIININEAKLEDFESLPGIGEAKAKSILEYREEKGDFEKIEDIMNVSGIGESMYEKIKNYITI